MFRVEHISNRLLPVLWPLQVSPSTAAHCKRMLMAALTYGLNSWYICSVLKGTFSDPSIPSRTHMGHGTVGVTGLCSFCVLHDCCLYKRSPFLYSCTLHFGLVWSWGSWCYPVYVRSNSYLQLPVPNVRACMGPGSQFCCLLSCWGPHLAWWLHLQMWSHRRSISVFFCGVSGQIYSAPSCLEVEGCSILLEIVSGFIVSVPESRVQDKICYPKWDGLELFSHLLHAFLGFILFSETGTPLYLWLS